MKIRKYPTQADIAKMKARGYDSATIAEAERRMNRWESAQRVCLEIEKAFAGVTLGNGPGLKEARGHDDWADAATCAAYRREDEAYDWSNIPSETLCHYRDTLSFFNAEGMRFHLPAFLIAHLRGECDDVALFSLTYSDRRTDPFALLSPAQRAAVRAYLLHIVDDPGSRFSESEIRRSLETYWTEP